MFGSGVLKGLGVTLKEFVNTYLDDIKRIPSRYSGGREVLDQSSDILGQSGLFTIQYPEEKRKLSERFRYIPMLLYEPETNEDRCTACGICAKVCPPQCIWIVRDRDEKGKPITRPAEFYIDASICMNCGLCAEFCPFDAIKMNHDYEIMAYERMPRLVFDLQELRVPTTYYAKIRPTDWAEEEAARAAEAERKAAAKAAPASISMTAKPVALTEAGAPAPVGQTPPVAPRRSPEEIERLKAEAAAKRAAKVTDQSTPMAPTPMTASENAGAEAAAAGPRKLSPEEVARLREEAAVKRAAKAAETQTEKTAGAETSTASASSAETSPEAQPPEANRSAPAGKLSPEELERRRAEAKARHQARKEGQDAPDK